MVYKVINPIKVKIVSCNPNSHNCQLRYCNVVALIQLYNHIIIHVKYLELFFYKFASWYKFSYSHENEYILSLAGSVGF